MKKAWMIEFLDMNAIVATDKDSATLFEIGRPAYSIGDLGGIGDILVAVGYQKEHDLAVKVFAGDPERYNALVIEADVGGPGLLVAKIKWNAGDAVPEHITYSGRFVIHWLQEPDEPS